MVVFRQSGCIRAKVVVFGKSCFTRVKCLYSGKVDVLEQSGYIREKVVVFG